VRRLYQRKLRSLDDAPWEAREYLRRQVARLRARDSSFEDEPGSAEAARAWAADELFLKLLQRCVPGPDPRSIETGRRELEKYLARNSKIAPAWEQLVDEQWVRVILGRWHVPYQLQPVPSPEQDVADKDLILVLAHLRVVSRRVRLFAVPDAEQVIAEHRAAHLATPTTENLIESGLLTKHGDTIHVPKRSPVLVGCGEWLAARLWDRTEAGPSNSERLTWWRERIFELEVRWYTFGEQLGAEARSAFLDQAWAQILADPDLVGWERERTRFAVHVAANSGIGSLQSGLNVVSELESKNPVDQMRWLNLAGFNNNQEERNEIDALISVQFRWRAVFRDSSPFQTWVDHFVNAAATRPHLLTSMVLAVGLAPESAVDFLLVPTAAAFGVYALASRLKRSGGSYDPDLRAEEDRNLEQVAWRAIAESAAWSLYQLPTADSAKQIGAILKHSAGLAQPNAYDPQGRQAALAARYHVLREVLVRWPASSEGCLSFDEIGGLVVRELEAVLEQVDDPLDSPQFKVVAWLAAFGSDGQAPWRAPAVRAVLGTYRRTLNDRKTRFHDIAIEADLWVRIAKLALDLGDDSWARLAEGANFDQQQVNANESDSGARHAEQRSLVHRVRTHLRLLLALGNNWHSIQRDRPLPEPLQRRILALGEGWLPADKAAKRPSMIDAAVDVEFASLARSESLLVPLARILPKLADKRHGRLRKLLLSAMTEVRQVATFLQALNDGADQKAARKKLRTQAKLASTEDIRNFVEVQRAVDALLDAGEAVGAESWLKNWAERARKRHIQGWASWEIAAIQRIRLGRERYEEAATAEPPAWVTNDLEAQRTNDFFRGIALLHVDPPRPNEAVRIYEKLVSDVLRPAYAVNLFAARTQALTHGRDAQELTQEDDDNIRALLAEGEALMSAFSDAQRALIEQTYQINRLYLFHRLGDWSSLLSAFQSLPKTLQGDATLASYAARAFESTGQAALGAALLGSLGLVSKEPVQQPLGMSLPNSAHAARQTILELASLSVADQALAWWGKDVGEGLTQAVVEVCMALAGIAPALALPTTGPGKDGTHEEDRVTKLVAELLRQQLAKLGWHVSSQEHGSYTDKDPSTGRGGIAKRDLEVKAGSRHVVVGEAVLTQTFQFGYIKKHYQELFGYGPAGTQALIHMIWSYSEDPRDLWKRYLEEIVVKHAPMRFGFSRWLAPPAGPTSQVWHAVSEHAHPDAGKCRVVHVLVDLKQQSARVVSAAARRGTARVAKASSKKTIRKKRMEK
jgi:hypothetical protein